MRKATEDALLCKDVASMIRDTRQDYDAPDSPEQLAHDVIVIVRERVLREIESYARQSIR